MSLTSQATTRVSDQSAISLDAATLAGTNCFVIGTGEERLMIDAGDDFPLNLRFVSNLETLMREKEFRLKVRLSDNSL